MIRWVVKCRQADFVKGFWWDIERFMFGLVIWMTCDFGKCIALYLEWAERTRENSCACLKWIFFYWRPLHFPFCYCKDRGLCCSFSVLLLQRQRPLGCDELCAARLLAAKQLLTSVLISDLDTFWTAAGHHKGLWDLPSSCRAKHTARHQEFGRGGPISSGGRSRFCRAEYPHWRADQGLAK